MQVRRLYQGTTPLLISIPHMGTFLPPNIKRRLTPAASPLPDTDWYLDSLYEFASEMGIGVLMSTHSRYVVDLNRAETDTDLYPGQVKTGLVPLETFAGQAIDRLVPSSERSKKGFLPFQNDSIINVIKFQGNS